MEGNEARNISNKKRFTDEELAEFKEVIFKKLKKAREEYEYYQEAVRNPNDHGTGESHSSSKMLEENSASSEKEYLSQLAERQKKFIQNLESALVRIENKTYGICRVTGKLISKERLKAVPHTTLSIEAKRSQSR